MMGIGYTFRDCLPGYLIWYLYQLPHQPMVVLFEFLNLWNKWWLYPTATHLILDSRGIKSSQGKIGPSDSKPERRFMKCQWAKRLWEAETSLYSAAWYRAPYNHSIIKFMRFSIDEDNAIPWWPPRVNYVSDYTLVSMVKHINWTKGDQSIGCRLISLYWEHNHPLGILYETNWQWVRRGWLDCSVSLLTLR